MFQRTSDIVRNMLVLNFADDAAASTGTGGGGGDVSHAPAGPATESASASARAALASGKSLSDFTSSAPAGGAPAVQQPRDEEGRFASATGTAAAADGQNTDAASAAPPVEGTDPNAPPVEAAQTEGGEPTEEVQGEEGGITIPGLAEGEEPIVLSIDDPDAAARIAALLDTRDQLQGYVAREQHVVQQVEQLEQVRDMIEVDPAGYMLNLMPNDPETVQHVAEFLLTRPEIWAALKDKVASWASDPTKLELAAAQAQNARLTQRDALAAAQATRREVETNYREVTNSLVRMATVDSLNADQRKQFHVDALRDIQHYATRNGLTTINVADIPALLAPRLRAYGIDPVAAAARASAPASAAQAPKKVVATVPAKAGAATQKTGDQFVAGQQKRDAFNRAAPAGGGVGSPSNTIEPPAGMGIEQTINWHREQLKNGKSALARS